MGAGLDWYSRWFDAASAVRGEASVTYTAFPNFPGIPKRMFETIPEAKLLYIVRDPIDRIVSDYVHRFSEGQEARPIS